MHVQRWVIGIDNAVFMILKEPVNPISKKTLTIHTYPETAQYLFNMSQIRQKFASKTVHVSTVYPYFPSHLYIFFIYSDLKYSLPSPFTTSTLFHIWNSKHLFISFDWKADSRANRTRTEAAGRLVHAWDPASRSHQYKVFTRDTITPRATPSTSHTREETMHNKRWWSFPQQCVDIKPLRRSSKLRWQRTCCKEGKRGPSVLVFEWGLNLYSFLSKWECLILNHFYPVWNAYLIGSESSLSAIFCLIHQKKW